MSKMTSRITLACWLFASSCGGGRKAMAVDGQYPMSTWKVGRFAIHLPVSAKLIKQTQVVEGVTLSYQPIEAIEPFGTTLDRRTAELAKDTHTPMVDRYLWTTDTGAVIYGYSSAYPDLYKIEALRGLPGKLLVATISFQKTKQQMLFKR